jgi:hypothetical protein
LLTRPAQTDPTTLFIDNVNAIALSQQCTAIHHKNLRLTAFINLKASIVPPKPKPRPEHKRNGTDLMGQ